MSDMKAPRLLDLFSGAGGAAMGYRLAGFEVVGVDIRPQPRYPFEFHQGNALEFVADYGGEFDAIHASPPCHDHSSLRSRSGADGTGWLLQATRDALAAHPVTVIENVEGAPMRADLVLCGSMFNLGSDGFVLRRHRLFESSLPLSAPGPDACAGRPAGGVHGGGPWKRSDRPGIKFNAEQARRAMGIGWMGRDALAQAIPPAYTRWIGEQLLSLPAGVDTPRVGG